MRDLNTDMSKIAFTPVIIALVAAILSLSIFAYANVFAADDSTPKVGKENGCGSCAVRDPNAGGSGTG